MQYSSILLLLSAFTAVNALTPNPDNYDTPPYRYDQPSSVSDTYRSQPSPPMQSHDAPPSWKDWWKNMKDYDHLPYPVYTPADGEGYTYSYASGTGTGTWTYCPTGTGIPDYPSVYVPSPTVVPDTVPTGYPVPPSYPAPVTTTTTTTVYVTKPAETVYPTHCPTIY